MSFRNRLILFLVVTLILVQAFTAAITLGVLRHNAIEEGKERLTAATLVFTRQLNVLSERVGEEVNILALDYALRQAIANGDRDTTLSVLRNHGKRVGATRMVLVNLDGTIAEDTTFASNRGKTFRFSGIVSAASNDRQAAALAELDGGVYWIVAVPVKAPVPIALIAACVPVDDALLSRLRTLSAFPDSVAIATKLKGEWSVAASSGGYRPEIHAENLKTANAAATEIVNQPDGAVLTWTALLATAPESAPVVAVLDYPLKAALAANRHVVISMLFVLAGALVLALCGALLIARSVARPIERLATTARHIAQGDYAPGEDVRASGEIGQLAKALDQMAVAIAERETGLKRAVGQLESMRDQAVRANEAKSQFLANISHELRTPLNAVLGFSEVMMNEMLGPIANAHYVSYARDINGSGRHLLELVEEMLDLARVESGTMTINSEAVDIGKVIATSIKMLGPVAQKAHVTLVAPPKETAWPDFTGDTRKLIQAVTNLIHNAVKFTPEGGSVTVSGEMTATLLVLRVTDTGIGIREQDIPIVVQPFQRLASAFDGRYQGAGLGLPFAKAVAELHGGALRIESAVGRGTTVIIELPLAAAGAARVDSAA